MHQTQKEVKNHKIIRSCHKICKKRERGKDKSSNFCWLSSLYISVLGPAIYVNGALEYFLFLFSASHAHHIGMNGHKRDKYDVDWNEAETKSECRKLFGTMFECKVGSYIPCLERNGSSKEWCKEKIAEIELRPTLLYKNRKNCFVLKFEISNEHNNACWQQHIVYNPQPLTDTWDEMRLVESNYKGTAEGGFGFTSKLFELNPASMQQKNEAEKHVFGVLKCMLTSITTYALWDAATSAVFCFCNK